MFKQISSYYLILISLSSGLIFLFPVVQFKLDETIFDFYLRGITIPTLEGNQNFQFPILSILALIITIIPIISLFIIKKYKTQITLGKIMYSAIISLIIALLFYINFLKVGLESSEKDLNVITGYRGFYCPIIAITFVFLANRSIKQELKIQELLEKLKNKN